MSRKQTLAYIFDAPALAAFHDFIDYQTLFTFDIDGTLAPITADANRIQISPAIQKNLLRLMEQTTVVIITGRARSDAEKHLGLTPHFLIGNHGAEGLPGQESYEADYLMLANQWERQLRKYLTSAEGGGIVIENKGATVSVHYRAAHNRTTARSQVLSRLKQLVPQPKIISGKCVEDLIPEAAPNKGDALLYLMKHLGYTKGFFIGDDKTDEDVFRLTGIDLFTIRVGTKGPSWAGYALRCQQEVAWLLHEIIDTLMKKA